MRRCMEKDRRMVAQFSGEVAVSPTFRWIPHWELARFLSCFSLVNAAPSAPLTTTLPNVQPRDQIFPALTSMEEKRNHDTESLDATIQELLSMIDFDALEELCSSDEEMQQSAKPTIESTSSEGKRVHHELVQELRYEIDVLRRQKEDLHANQHLRESLDRLLSTTGEPSSRLYASEEKKGLAIAKRENTQLKERVRANIKIIKQAKSILDKQHAGARAVSASSVIDANKT